MKQNDNTPPPQNHRHNQQRQYQNHRRQERQRNHQHHYYQNNIGYFPNQSMINHHPQRPIYGDPILLPHQIMSPAYSSTISPLPYNSPMLMQDNSVHATMDFDRRRHYISQPILLPHQLMSPAYGSTVGPLPYNSSMSMQENYAHATMDFDHRHYISQPATLASPPPPPTPTREHEGTTEIRIGSSGSGGYFFHESDDRLLNLLMRITFNPEEEIALVDLNRGQEAVVFDPYEDWNSYLEQLAGPGDNWSEESISQQLKTRKYQTPASAKQVEDEEEAEICVVCQSEYENQEILATLDCRHEYHANCIKRWLIRKNFCPICKRKALPQQS